MNLLDVIILITIAIACASAFGPLGGGVAFIAVIVAALIMRGDE